MKHPSENAKRWMDQAEYDLEVARSNLNAKFYADACFKSEQSAQKSLKAYLYLKGARFVAEYCKFTSWHCSFTWRSCLVRLHYDIAGPYYGVVNGQKARRIVSS